LKKVTLSTRPEISTIGVPVWKLEWLMLIAVYAVESPLRWVSRRAEGFLIRLEPATAGPGRRWRPMIMSFLPRRRSPSYKVGASSGLLDPKTHSGAGAPAALRILVSSRNSFGWPRFFAGSLPTLLFHRDRSLLARTADLDLAARREWAPLQATYFLQFRLPSLVIELDRLAVFYI